MKFKPGDIVKHKVSKKEYVVLRGYFSFFLKVPYYEVSSGADGYCDVQEYEIEIVRSEK